jgi:hypothetical protein
MSCFASARKSRVLSLVIACFLAGVGAGGLVPGCSDDASDCHWVCTRFKDCVNAQYDSNACETRCRDKAGKDRDFDDQLEHCASCAHGRSCSETVASCFGACLLVVP